MELDNFGHEVRRMSFVLLSLLHLSMIAIEKYLAGDGAVCQ